MIFKKFRITVLAFVIGLGFLAPIFAQTERIRIPYRENAPIVDGLPDDQTNNICWQKFAYAEKSDSSNPDIDVMYKMVYGFDYLYVLIRTDCDSIIYRDRAYQNGDGFHLVIAKPESDRSAEEFYVLRFSPANESKKLPARKGVWYYNIDLSAKSLSTSTGFVCRSAKNVSYFEMKLPWNDIPPYHPLFSDSVGLNLCFVKAISKKERNFYYLKYDRNIQFELSSRAYLRADFESPLVITGSRSYTQLLRNNLEENQNLKIKTTSIFRNEGMLSFYYSIRSADNYSYKDFSSSTKISGGINTNELSIPLGKLLPGGYKLFWRTSDNSEGEIPFSVLPDINYDKELNELNLIKNRINEGDYNTLVFTIKNLVMDYERLKKYETAGEIRERYLLYRDKINKFQTGNDPFSVTDIILRRAFLSKIDNTLQPYSLKLPENYDKNRKYPLFVMLHGSGSDDQHTLDNSFTGNNFIQIAPNGRGTSNCFTTDSAEIDVKEAIDDVIKYYPVDTSKIVIAGFSMGGYGAYRIFYEYPKLFKAVAVFSGHPNLASKWIGDGYPDFLDSKYLKPFRNIPMFIYHSKDDLNCPFELTLQLIEKLKASGAIVNFLSVPESGHGVIDIEHIDQFYKWLNESVAD